MEPEGSSLPKAPSLIKLPLSLMYIRCSSIQRQIKELFERPGIVKNVIIAPLTSQIYNNYHGHLICIDDLQRMRPME